MKFARLTGELVQHRQRRFRALIEKPIGEVAVGQCPGELQGADHEAEDRERVRPSGLDVCWVQARGDVVDLGHQFVGEDLSGGGGAAGDLVEQRSRRAAVGALVAVLGGRRGPPLPVRKRITPRPRRARDGWGKHLVRPSLADLLI